ncbi:MAG: dehydrogenase, partial [Candidatus Saccharimonas sp.]|nr:dehydrogenase [Planctomycetaceae bacterium]
MTRACVGVSFFVCLAATAAVYSQGHPAAEAARRMQVPAGLEVRLVASEPLVRQPVCIEFDDRGRLWAIQYLQYPNPAGLTRTKVDRFSRTEYDRLPEPPPKGPVGADRITILEDTDGDGMADRGRDFVAGLNLTSGLAFGYGGVFVLQTPYLLFYPDRNRDDVPDADPEVLLTGFGMDDAHSVANSLTWGPDGWLYGCQGSTVTARIRGIEFQQGVWRYHPLTHEFELYCEGGGNSWGLDFDRHGRLLYSTNHGGYRLLHGLPGAYYWKSFGKHGPLHNPFAFGYFDHAPHRDFRGGHVTVGGIVYRGDGLPAIFRDTYISADLLGHGMHWNEIQPRGSTVATAHGGDFLISNDTWFAPSDVTTGPDGAVYVCDWHDSRTAHPDPDAEWDRSNGRIYRIAI